MKQLDLSGQRFGRLVAVSVATGRKYRSWECACDCGNKLIVKTGTLTSGNTKSCGCAHIDNLNNTLHRFGFSHFVLIKHQFGQYRPNHQQQHQVKQ